MFQKTGEAPATGEATADRYWASLTRQCSEAQLPICEKGKERPRPTHSYILELRGGPKWILNVMLISVCFKVANVLTLGDSESKGPVGLPGESTQLL